MNADETNYTKEAFLLPWNLVFLIVAMLTAFVASTYSDVAFNAILILTFAMELLYLGIMPRQERFKRVVRARRIEEHRKPLSSKEIYQQLKRRNQRRYVRMRNLEKSIRDNYRQLSYASQGLLDSHLKKIDGLLDSYLKLLKQQERYEDYAESTTENDVVRAITALREDMEDDSSRVRRIKQRRLHVLEQRLARFKKSSENLEIIEAQLETIEDVVRYIYEQSWTLQNPEEITFQLDTLLDEVHETQASVEEIEDVFGARAPDLLDEMDEMLGNAASDPELHLDLDEPASERDTEGGRRQRTRE